MSNVDFSVNNVECNKAHDICNMIFSCPFFCHNFICSQGYQYLWSIHDTNFQECLMLVSEEGIYQNHKIRFLKRLRSLLDYKYDIVKGNMRLAHCLPTRLNFENDIINPIALNMSSYYKRHSVENHFVDFFEWIRQNTSIKTESIVSEKRDYTDRYVSYLDWILLSLYFIYFDGRIFESNDGYDDLPRFKRKNSCSHFSYKIALRQTLMLFDKIIPELHKNEDFIFTMIQLYKIDKEFKFFKINRMCSSRELFLSEDSINEIMDLFPMKPNVALNLKNIFDEHIFKNKSFVDVCISSSNPDPFYMFDCYFKSTLKYINDRLKYFQDFELPEGTKIDDLIIAIKIKVMDLLLEDDVKSSDLNQSYNIDKINFNFWTEYYFNNRDMLKKYADSKSTKEIEYMNYLFDIVIDSLPKYEKYDK